jgi:hypothetical protein
MALSGMQWGLEVVLVLMLAATLFYALRLERALGVLKRDRTTLEGLVSGFNEATQQAQQGIERLHAAADGAGRQMARQIESVNSLKDDLQFLIERGDRLADRMDGLVRGAAATEQARAAPAEVPRPPLPENFRVSPAPARGAVPDPARAQYADAAAEPADPPLDAAARMRSQAERDLFKALRMAR